MCFCCSSLPWPCPLLQAIKDIAGLLAEQNSWETKLRDSGVSWSQCAVAIHYSHYGHGKTRVAWQFWSFRWTSFCNFLHQGTMPCWKPWRMTSEPVHWFCASTVKPWNRWLRALPRQVTRIEFEDEHHFTSNWLPRNPHELWRDLRIL